MTTSPTPAPDAREAERAALVEVITARDYFPLWSTPTQVHAEQIADRILKLGFTRSRGGGWLVDGSLS
jgi:hypothetical protein